MTIMRHAKWPLAALILLGLSRTGWALDAAWCANRPTSVSLGESTKIPDGNIHMILGKDWKPAIAMLRESTIRRLNKNEASRLIGSSRSNKKYSYLIRAAAHNVFENNSKMNSIMSAYIYPRAQAVTIYNYSLSKPGSVPTNLAVVIETDVKVSKIYATCQTME